ncbi:MAG: amidoligase family protein [Elusimicrobia bacterium]|nr:amidoligase family protein [Elusimicrobiota bacterium]
MLSGSAAPKFWPGLNFIDKRSRFIAAEIEIAESNTETCKVINEAIEKWKAAVVKDGSLPDTGYEINTAPAQGSQFVKQITEICEALEFAGAYTTHKCGLHIHIDCRDLKVFDLRKVLYAYLKVEDNLFEMIAPSRQNNLYCKRLHETSLAELPINKMDAKKWRKSFLESMYIEEENGRKINNLTKGKFRRDKYHNHYYAMNLHSFFFRQTIEFRHHHGTINAREIINWANICQEIINFAVKNSEKEIKQLLGCSVPLEAILPKNLGDYFREKKSYFAREREAA